MAVNIVRKSKNEDEEERRKQLLAQIQEQSQARKNADIQAVQDKKLNWVDPNVNLGTGIGWLGRTAGNQAQKSVLDTLTALPQSYSVGLQRGANQAGQENSTWDKIKNFGKNYLKSIAIDPMSRLLYNTTIGRNDYNDKINQIATQTSVNTSQADSTWKKATGYIGGITSFAGQEIADYGLVGQLYTSGQQVGQVLGEENATNVSNKIREFDDKIHEKNEKRAEELAREGSLYKGSSNKVLDTIGGLEGAAQTIGYMTPSIAINLATGGSSSAGQAIGLTQMGLASKSNTTREGVKQGLDYETAERRGIVSGEVEVGTELMWNGLDQFKALKQNGLEGTIKNWISDTVEKKFTNELIQKGLKTAGNWLVDVSGESIEELTSDIYNTWLERATLDPNKQYTINDAINTVVQTIASTTFMNAGQAGLGRIADKVGEIRQSNAQRKGQVTEVEQTASNGYKENLQEMINNLDVPDEIKAQIQPMLDSSDIIDTEQYKYITNELKTLVKANTQQQIQNYGIELTNQNNAIEEQRQALDNIKPETFKNKDYRRLYAQVQNESALNDETYNNILTLYPTNKNGNRPLSDWQNIAKDYGKAMAEEGRSFDEVRHNIVKIWSDEAPYSRQQSSKNGERIPRQKWYPVDQFSQAAYDSYRDTMKAQLDQQQQELGKVANARLEELQDEENILIDTIDNLQPRIEAVKSSLVQSAEQYGYKGKQISEIQDLMKRRGINAYFDETQFNNDSEGAFYNPKTNEIVFNPNASQDQVIQELAVHEWYHDLKAKGQGEEIQQSVIDFLKNNKDYQDLRKSLENAYAKLTDPNTGEYLYDIESKEFSDMIDEEATAKTLQRVLGNETEIQRLINYKPSLARRIYDAVVDLLNKFTGGRIEKLYWQDVRNKFESAFNETGIDTRQGKIRFDINGDGKDFFYRGQENEGNNLSYNSTNFIGSEDEGFYFTPNKETASKYGKNLIEKYRNENNTVTVAESDKLQKMATDIINEHMKQGIWEDGDDILEQMALGRSKAFAEYTGKPFVETGDMFGEEAEAVYYPEFDKETNNISTTDNQGRELSEEQQEYFKDSKVRDSEGNLITLYHGTDSEVTTFDTNKPTYARYGSGAYLTDGIGIASEFADIRAESNNGKARIIEGYANIDKMFDNTTGLTENTPERQKLFELLKERGLSDRQLSNIESAEIDYPFQLMERYLVKDEVTNDPWIKANTVNELLREAGYNGIKGYYGDGSYEYVTFNSNQIKDIENKKPTTSSDIRYSVKTDNQGNKINPGMQEYLKDVSPEELVDGKVPLVYHTTTDETSQFNIFNPVGTPYYRFGNQVVNYYTDSKDMSGSYASSKYKMADTKKLNNIEEAKQYLYDYGRTTGNLLTISQNESGKYVLNQEKQTNNEARNFVDNLSEDEMQQMRDNIFYDKDMEGTPYEYAFSWDKFDKSLQEKFKNVTDKYIGTADKVDLENEIMKYVRQPELLLNNDSINGEIVKEYNSEDELLRNIKEDIGKTNWSKNSRVQYQGYVKLTNPYVVDAEERNWNQVVSQSNDFIDELTETVSEDTINNLSRLYKESQEISADARAEYYKYDNIIQSINTPDIGFNEYTVDNDTQSMNHLLRRTSLNDILLLDSGDTNLGVSTWFSIADVLQQDGIIGEATAKNITDDFKLPEQVKNWIHNELYKEINVGLEDVHNLKELYEKKNEAYQKFDKYRYETSYFKEKIMADESEEGYVDLGELNNLLEQRAEVRGADVVADEIAQASSVGFSKPELIRLWGTSKTTNDIVKEVIASNQDGTTNYDGVIIKNVYDYGGKSENETRPANVYVTFNSNQFKAQDNMNPTADPDIRYQNETNFDDWANNNLPSLGEGKTTLGELRTEQPKLPVNQPKTTQPILPTKQTQTISSTIEEPTLKVPVPKGNTGTEQKVAKVLSEPITKVKPEQRAWALFKANILDKGAVFEDLSFKAKNRELQAKWDSTLLAEAKGQNAIGQARYEFENGEEKQVSKALTDIIDEVGENSEDFNNYMYHQLNIDRMTLEDRFDIANKPVFGDGIDANYSKQKVAELEKAHPEFKEYAQDVYDYLDTNKKELVDNGVISQETSDKFKEMYPHYVPIARIDAKGQAINVPLDTNRTGVNSPIKRAKGGSQDIQPLFQTIADRTMQTYKASSRNSFGLELKNTLDNLGMFNQLETTTENADNENLFEYDGEKGNLTEGTKYQNPTFTVFENGEKVTYEINQDMYDALRPKNEIFSKWDNTKLMKATRKLNDIRRGILTEYNPAFSITNAIKDAQDVLMNSQHAGKTYAKFGEAYSQILKKGYWYKEYVQNGGSQNSYFTDGDFVKQDSKVKSIIKMPLEAISNVNNVIEMAPRLAEYIASREQGKSVQSAMLDASRVTTNFKAGGDVTKFANRNGATFLNASVQGLQQNIRNIREANAKGLKGYGVLLGKAVIAGLPALILNNLVWKDDEDYEELQDYVKDNYYIIAKIGDHKFLRIPKGRTVAVIQKAVTNMSDFITNKDEIDPDKYSEVIWGDLKDTFELASNNLAPNNPIENNIVSPIVQAVNNKTWYGEDLVPSRLKDKPNEEKYDESTAEISKQISGVLNKIGINTNPMQINYLLDQYGGGVADVLLPMGTPQAENNMIEDKFTTDSVMKSRYPGEFFELKDKLAVNRNSSKATDEDELLYKYANNVSGELSDLYQKKREIQNSSLTDKEKKKQIAEVQKQINSKTQQALKDIKEPKVSGDTATIGNSEYIKTLNANSGEYQWNKLTDKTRIQGVSLKTQADYQNRLAKYKQKTGDSQLSDKEEAQIILDGNYSSKDKKAIYIATVGKKDTLYKSVSDNLNIDEYLNYKTANIQGVKDSNGKTISGTKKTAQLDYINNNISGYENRLLLMGKDYKLSRSQQQDLSAYIDTLDNAEELYTMFDKNFTVKSSSSLGQYGKGNIDLYNRPIVTNSDGSISTVRSMSFEENGKEILIPTVVNGRVVSDDEAIDHYHRTGEYLGKFNSVKEADDYAEKLHEDQEKMYSSGGRTTGYTVYYK